MKPIIINLKNCQDDRSMDVVVQAILKDEAEVWTRNYFGDHRTDYRNKNTVEYVQSDFSQENVNLYHFHVTLG